MKPQNDILQKVLDLPQEAYFHVSKELKTQLLLKLSDLDFHGYALAAPPSVDLDVHDRFPAILMRQYSDLREWEVRYKLNTMVVAVDLQSGKAYAVHAYRNQKRRYVADVEKSRSGEKPGPEDDKTLNTGLDELEISSLCWITLEQSRYAVTVLAYDQASNTTATTFFRRPERGAPRAAKRVPFSAALAFAQSNNSADVVKNAPVYVPTPRSPRLEGEGVAIAWTSERVAFDGPIRFSCAVKLPAFPDLVVDDPVPGRELDADQKKLVAGGRIPKAFIPVSVVLQELDNSEPFQAQALVPVFSTNALKPDGAVEGYFEGDLAKWLPDALARGTYMAWAVAGAQVSGPYKLTVE